MLKKISAKIHPQTEDGFSQPKEWTRIAAEFNKLNSKSNSYRTPRQCRERWINAINPSVSHEKWKLQEDHLILSLWK